MREKLDIYQIRQGGNINSPFSVIVHKHGGGHEDQVSVGVTIHVHGAHRCPKVFSTLNIAKKKKKKEATQK